MKLTTYLPTATALFTLAGSTTAATIPAPPVETAKIPTNEKARADCYLLAPYRRQACLRSLMNPRRNVVAVLDAETPMDAAAVEAVAAAASPAHDGLKGADSDGLAERNVSSDLGDLVELGGKGGEDGKARLIHKKPVVHPTPIFLPVSTFPAEVPTFLRLTRLNDPAVPTEDGKMHYTIGKKRDIAVTAAAEAGAIDLAIPVSVAPATSPVPTTLRTVTTATPTRLDPITIDETISMATTTYPVHRTLQTATLANGTEIRIEQTESQVHDVHIEETEHEKDEPEQDKVIVHVKVFVEHVKEAAAKVKRSVQGLVGIGKRDGEIEEKGQVESEVGEGREWGCYCKWYGCFCGYHGKDKEDGWTK